MIALIRRMILVSLAMIAFIVLPAVAFSMTGGVKQDRGANNPAQSPLPTVTTPGTVPPPTAIPTRRPWPTATRHRRPVAAANPVVVAPRAAHFGELALIDGAPIRNVIGNLLHSTLYAYTFDRRLFRSDDSGMTWQLVTTQPARDNFVFSPADPSVLYSGEGNLCDGLPRPPQPLYKSTDSGENWQMLPNAAGLRPLLLDPIDAERVFAASCTMLFLSEDGGASWTATPGNGDEQLWQGYRAIAMAFGAPQIDSAATIPQWSQLFVGGAAGDGSGIVAFSNNLGNSWVRLTPNVLPAPWGMSALAVDQTVQGRLAFAEPHGVWESANFGVDWQFISKGLETVVERKLAGGVFGLNDLAFHPGGTLFLATVRGLYAKDFAATSWKKISGTAYDDRAISQIVYNVQNPDVFWLNTPDGVYILDLIPI